MDAEKIKKLRGLATIPLPSWGDTHEVFDALPELLDAAEREQGLRGALKEIANEERCPYNDLSSACLELTIKIAKHALGVQ